MISCLRLVLALGAVRAAFVYASDGTYKILWSTDFAFLGYERNGLIGPDRPWQAVQAQVGFDPIVPLNGCWALLWPSMYSSTVVLNGTGGGNYTGSPGRSATSVDIEYLDSDERPPLVSETFTASSYYDILNFDSGVGPTLNITVSALNQWDIRFPNGRNSTAPAGELGLGLSEDASNGSSLLGQMKANGSIKSMFYGLYMGSASFEQPGSLILGGYEQNRVIGHVGTFNLQPGGPEVFMLDVILGVEIGGSPFNQSNNISLWNGMDDGPGAELAKLEGGKAGSRIIVLDPSLPYLYMPPGICEAAAQYLPIIWNAGIGLYTWIMGEEISRIVGSPAFMAIVLADKSAQNLTIKVPFQLLNLTISAPIAHAPMQYFPCTTWNSTGYVLGRTFLQAAFVGYDFENNLTYVAQAPGPDMEQSIIKTYQANDKMITRNPLGTYASSWKASWKILPSNTTTSSQPISPSTFHSSATTTSQPEPPSTLHSSATTTSQPESPSTFHKGLSGGTTAGVVVGSVLGALGIIAAVAMWWTKKRIGHSATIGRLDATVTPPLNDQSLGTSENPAELAACVKPSEVQGNALPHEMAGQHRVEAPNQLDYSELPTGKTT